MIIDEIIEELKNKGVSVDMGFATIPNTNKAVNTKHREKRSNRSAHLHSQGLCTFCGVREAAPTKKKCTVCCINNKGKKNKNAK